MPRRFATLLAGILALVWAGTGNADETFDRLQALAYSDPASALLQIDEAPVRLTLGPGEADLIAARALYYQNSFRDSLSRLARAEPQFSPTLRPARYAALRALVAQNYYRMGSLEQAMIAAREAERIAETADDRPMLAQIYNIIAAVYVASAEPEPALDYFQRALTLFEALDSRSDIAKLRNNLGVLYIESGDFEQAEPHLQASLTAARELGRTTTIIANLVNLAELYAKRGDLERSRAAVDECFSIANSLADGSSQVWCHEAAMEHFREAQDLPQAIVHAQQALALSRKFELQQQSVDNARELAALLAASGDYAQAQQMSEEAIAGMDQIRDGLLKLRLEQVDAIRDYERAQAEVGALQLSNAYAERQKLLLYLGLAVLLPLLAISLWLLRSKGRLVTQLARASAFNRKLARTDSLTGLPNRRAFIERAAIEHAREQRERTGYSVLLVDIDHFKAVNDRLGHEAGDQVLRHVAAALTGILRASDTAARWGGEEFVVLVTGPGNGADEYAHRLRRSLGEQPAVIDGTPCPVTLSIGIAVSRGREPMQVIAAADAAMYDAKLAGRDRVCSEAAAGHGDSEAQA